MPNKILWEEGTAKVFANLADYAGDGGARTHQINLTSLAATAARQSDKVDMSTDGAHLPHQWTVTARIEFDAEPTAGDNVNLFWAPSLSSEPGDANPGGVSGADGAYTGVDNNIDESTMQLLHIGSVICTPDMAPVVIQQSFVVSSSLRYGSLVVVNNADQDFEGDAVEMSVTFTPLEDEAQ